MPTPRQTIVRALAVGLLIGSLACGGVIGADGEAPDPNTPASIESVSEGGIAALELRTRVDSATGAFAFSLGPICVGNTSVCAKLDSGSGTLSRAEVDAFFARTRQPEFRALLADYGLTPNSADMRITQLTIHSNGASRTIRADDGTMPTMLAHFLHDVDLAVRSAR